MPDPNDLERGQPDKRDLLLKQTTKSKMLLFRGLQNWANFLSLSAMCSASCSYTVFAHRSRCTEGM
jgi:hypothetical protein